MINCRQTRKLVGQYRGINQLFDDVWPFLAQLDDYRLNLGHAPTLLTWIRRLLTPLKAGN